MSTLRSFKKDKVEERLKNLGSNTSILQPVQLKRTNLRKAKSSIGSFVGGLVPVFFVTFCFVGAMYPAIDLFTGEKERGTIETLLVLPSSRFQILFGKMLVIISTGVISGILTFLGIYLFFKINAHLPFISTVIDLKAALWMILLMIPLTTFFAGLLIPISIHARSFKEAQSLTQPLVILIMFPVIAALFSSATLNLKTAWIPIFNIALACKDVVSDTIDPLSFLMVFVAMTVLAIFGIWLARFWFEKEKNIFRS